MDNEDIFYSEEFFYVPERTPWNNFIPFPDEDELEPAENVIDDILYFEV